ncbi:PAS domain-containing sensor histidine kinase [Bradyrhizobium sp. 2S1]|uniref:PAS domain-containing sensor histidine kinase n=1 Tax=Bradyrhizobium sp. 2S1 TaxID=1404429 RepID=UPI001CD0745F|nr:PAS domain S-box protein [Bradyrhizobium sp. 2S1]MCK7674012.1 PAS domain S-box protein [Bradyrhizobium sp. 2S1]
MLDGQLLVLPMMRNPTTKPWSTEQRLLGGMVLAWAGTCAGLLLGPEPAATAHLAALAALIAALAAALLMMRVVGRTQRQMEAALRGRASGEERAIEALRNSKAQWKEVFEHNPVMYFMVDATGLVLSVNTFGAAQLGYTVDELLGQSVLQVFAAEDRDMVQRNVAACLDNIGQTQGWEIRKVRKDGSRLWVRENAKAVRRLGDQLIVLIACEDITERKQAENALQQSEMYLTEAQRLSHTGSFGWHVANGEMIWSEETFRIFEFDKAPCIKHGTVLQRVHPNDRTRVQRTIDRASVDGKDFEHGYRLLMPNGAIKYVHARAHAVTNISGDTEFIGAVTDVTARKRAESELHEAQMNLAHVTRVTALGELAASIAHEVNQPLAAVVTNAAACLRWLNRAAPDLNEARGAVRSIISDGNRAGEVIQRVRALVNKTTDQKAPLDINAAINEVIGLVQHELQSHLISLQLDLAPALPPVIADRIQLQQVILNLVLNGIEAMQPVTDRPRELVIRTRIDPAKHDDAGQILVTVTDCGVGITTENADRLFDAFYTTKASGMGMGLSICRSIVEAHRGRLSVAGNTGPGATFQFTLPLREEDHAW